MKHNEDPAYGQQDDWRPRREITKRLISPRQNNIKQEMYQYNKLNIIKELLR